MNIISDSTCEPLLAFHLFQQLRLVPLGIFSEPYDNNTILHTLLWTNVYIRQFTKCNNESDSHEDNV